MSDNDSINNVKNNKKGSFLKIFLIVIVFLSLGIFAGIYGTTKYLESKEKENDDVVVTDEDMPIDITEDEEYKDLITELYKVINGNTLFYSTKGIDIDLIDNNTKLILIYNYLVSTQQGSSETLNQTYWGSSVCQNNFLVDPTGSDGITKNICTITKFSRDLFLQTSQKLFNNNVLDTSVNFNPSSGKSCVMDMTTNTYSCGNVSDTSGITGELESRFTIEKVTKEEGIIKIYEKGYLLDNRSNVKAQYPNYDNIYLHSTDSTEYYFELRNADNLTFVHTFKLNDNNEYYYSGTSLEE